MLINLTNKTMKKLLDFQKKVGAIGKDSTNPFFKSKYFDINKLIEITKPILNDLGLVLIQPLTHIEGKPALKTILIDIESKEKIEDTIILPEDTNPQKMGSIITYYRRYAIQSLLFLQAEDDDCNGSKKAKNEPPKPVNPSTPTKSPKDIKKAKIVELAKATKPDLTNKEMKNWIEKKTGEELIEKNYDQIIGKLELTKAGL